MSAQTEDKKLDGSGLSVLWGLIKSLVRGKSDKTSTVSTVGYDTTNKKITKTINGTTTDVVTASTIVTDGNGVKTDDSRLSDSRPANGGNSATVNNHNVNKDVPSDAKFTDTTYSDATTLVHGLMSTADKLRIDTLSRISRKTNFDLSVLKQAVSDSDLEKYGLRVGDQKTINGHTYVIAGLNPMKGVSTPYCVTQNHVGLIVIPHLTHTWNDSGNAYTGANNRGAGYLNSDLHYYIENTVLPLVNTDLGSANLIGHSKLLSSAINKTRISGIGEANGCSSGWTWEENCKICALTEVQVFGTTIWSSSGYDTAEASRQLDVFRKYRHTEIFGDENIWLRDVVSATQIVSLRDRGYSGVYSTANDMYVAALILFNYPCLIFD